MHKIKGDSLLTIVSDHHYNDSLQCKFAGTNGSIIVSSLMTPQQCQTIDSCHYIWYGVDCKNIRNLIHRGPLSNIKEYIQETGGLQRTGCDNLPTEALLQGEAGKVYKSQH